MTHAHNSMTNNIEEEIVHALVVYSRFERLRLIKSSFSSESAEGKVETARKLSTSTRDIKNLNTQDK